jgi:hypothetical protein
MRMYRATVLFLTMFFGATVVSAQQVINIANQWSSVETDYASVRGWRVVSARMQGRFAYCAAEKNDRGGLVRLGYDNQQWQLAVPFDNPPSDVYVAADVDGRKLYTSGVTDDSWVFIWLGLQEVSQISKGNMLVVDISRVSFDYSLSGSAAAILKVEECVANRGDKPRAASSSGSGTVESDALRLGGNCPSLWPSPSSNEPATIEFIDRPNPDQGAVTVYWIDFQGNPTEIGIFDENNTLMVDSFVGHGFIVKDFAGNCYGGVYVTEPGYNRFVVR